MSKESLHNPYPGLRPYYEDEHKCFFGREADTSVLIDKILAHRLTLLFAATGVGKSSLLQASVIPQLKSPRNKNLVVVYYNDWVSSPMEGLKSAIEQTLNENAIWPEAVAQNLDTSFNLPAFIEFCTLFTHHPLVIVLDQFEELFRYRKQYHQQTFLPFIEHLTLLVTATQIPVSLVFSMREDFALELNAFKPKLPTLLFENFYRLEKLPKEEARLAIKGPVEQLGCKYEPELLERLMQDLSSYNRDTDDLPHVLPEGKQETVEPPYLQIVCARLWELKEEKDNTLRLADFEYAGGATGIIKYFLDETLVSFSQEDKKLASRAFDYLVSQRGVKMAYPVNMLARILRIKEQKLARVLAKLADVKVRILRGQQRGGVMWYELYHDMFSPSIESWNHAWKERQQHRKLWFMGGAITLLLALITLLVDSFIWIDRNNFPADYLFQQQKFRLVNLGLLHEPLPEMVEINVGEKVFNIGEQETSVIEKLTSRKPDLMENFGVPGTTAHLKGMFFIGKYEITYEQYDYYIWQQRKKGASEKEFIYPTGATRDNGRGQRAVTQVSWLEAKGYANWLSKKTGMKYRLPTEVEWEYAARADTSTGYWWGNEVGKNRANCKDCGSSWDHLLVAPVGQFRPNAFGLYDTSGNVAEWTCSEWQKEYNGSESTCSQSTSGGRVFRGGSWAKGSPWVRSSSRNKGNAGTSRYDHVGFRVLKIPVSRTIGE